MFLLNKIISFLERKKNTIPLDITENIDNLIDYCSKLKWEITNIGYIAKYNKYYEIMLFFDNPKFVRYYSGNCSSVAIYQKLDDDDSKKLFCAVDDFIFYQNPIDEKS
jgi:hypothetical protein